MALAVMWRLPCCRPRSRGRAANPTLPCAKAGNSEQTACFDGTTPRQSASLRETLHASGPVRCRPAWLNAVAQVWLVEGVVTSDEEAWRSPRHGLKKGSTDPGLGQGSPVPEKVSTQA